MKILVAAKDYLVEPISMFINSSFSSGIFPEILKNAQLTPIHKKGVTSDKSNYRPICVLLYLSKIFENVCPPD